MTEHVKRGRGRPPLAEDRKLTARAHMLTLPIWLDDQFQEAVRRRGLSQADALREAVSMYAQWVLGPVSASSSSSPTSS